MGTGTDWNIYYVGMHCMFSNEFTQKAHHYQTFNELPFSLQKPHFTYDQASSLLLGISLIDKSGRKKIVARLLSNTHSVNNFCWL